MRKWSLHVFIIKIITVEGKEEVPVLLCCFTRPSSVDDRENNNQDFEVRMVCVFALDQLQQIMEDTGTYEFDLKLHPMLLSVFTDHDLPDTSERFPLQVIDGPLAIILGAAVEETVLVAFENEDGGRETPPSKPQPSS